jgi:hypothetical protein
MTLNLTAQLWGKAFARVGLSLGFVALLYGCVAPSLVGTHPSPTPPRLVVVATQDSSAAELIAWDRPLAFGPVPQHLKVTGDVSCLRTRVDLEAIGYHPGALNREGKPIPAGGFFCFPKQNGSKPGNPAPQLVFKEGVFGWDRPSAFGEVPQDQKVRGAAVCAAIDKDFDAIGYHPLAKDVRGKPIAEGGFFCAKPLDKDR